MKKNALLLITVTALLTACEPTVASRGNLLEPDLLAQIQPGTSTREEVAAKLGTPTEISTFDDKIWFYVGRQTEQYSFLKPSVIKQQATEVDFDDQGKVVSIRNLDLSQAGDITPVARETPTYGHDNTFIRQLLGDLSHPMPNLGGSPSHTGQ